MESKFVSYILISVVLGGAIGFGLSYVTFNNKIVNLQNELQVASNRFNSLSSNLQEV